MSECKHDIADREMACADGYCPLCSVQELSQANERIARLEKERDAWMEDAARHCRNEDFYRGLVCGIGDQFGDAAHISDDGSRQQDVLCLKVPELVAAKIKEADELREVGKDALTLLEAADGYVDNLGIVSRLRAVLQKYPGGSK